MFVQNLRGRLVWDLEELIPTDKTDRHELIKRLVGI